MTATRMALAHEWLDARAGSEKAFEVLAGMFPQADLYALTDTLGDRFDSGGRPVHTTFLGRVPALRTRRDLALPLMPLAWRTVTRRRYDLVLTSSHACVKAFAPAREALHLSYCYTPMRYVWLSSLDRRRPVSRVTAPIERWLKEWDLASVAWVDDFAAISTAVGRRIEELYGRSSRVIHPPVDTAHYTPGEPGARKGFALAVSRMVGYKRLDVAIRACHRLQEPLVVAGAGPAEAELRALVAQLGADVRFVIDPDDNRLRELYRAAGVVVFPGEEDFGIVPVEAQACGTPVVALAAGGTLDTIVPGTTGILVPEQSDESFADGIRRVLDGHFDPADCRRSAERFSLAVFEKRFVDWVTRAAAARGMDVDHLRHHETV